MLSDRRLPCFTFVSTVCCIAIDVVARALLASGAALLEAASLLTVNRFVRPSLIAFVCALSGCGGAMYAASINTASTKLQTAEALGAERTAAYEYYYAQEHFRKAMEEASLADYSDAINYATRAAEYADKAIMLTKQMQEGSGQ